MKAVAAKKEWKHNSNKELFYVVGRLSKKLNDKELSILFTCASGLRTNFYEGWFGEETVKSSALEVKRFVEKMKLILNSDY